jgi:uncharacterized OsmC-like protein
MITCKTLAKSKPTISNGKCEIPIEAAGYKGGQPTGFNPVELLEAAIASDMTATIQLYAETEGYPFKGVTVSVSLDDTSLTNAVFKYSVKLDEELDDRTTKLLMQSVFSCRVRQTLAKRTSIQYSSRF